MIDIHCHILPGVDDGPQTLEEALAMAQYAVLEGIRAVIATPHHGNGKWNNEAPSVSAAVKALNAELQHRNIPLKVFPGQEVRIGRSVIDEFAAETTISLNRSQYILIEFPFTGIPDYADDLLHELRVNNCTPIIAHPERNREIAANPDILCNFINRGALGQLTAQSLTGFFGKKLQRLSKEFIRRDLVHFIASDAHNAQDRPFALAEAYAWLEASYGSERAIYFQRNAECVVHDRECEIPDPKPGNRSLIRFWK